MILFSNSPLFLSQDSLLAAPIILDLVILCEVCERIKFKVGDDPEFQSFNPVLSLLSYLLKAPLVPSGTPVVNALFKQRSCIENIFRWAGFAPVFHAFNKWHLIFTRITCSQERSLDLGSHVPHVIFHMSCEDHVSNWLWKPWVTFRAEHQSAILFCDIPSVTVKR